MSNRVEGQRQVGESASARATTRRKWLVIVCAKVLVGQHRSRWVNMLRNAIIFTVVGFFVEALLNILNLILSLPHPGEPVDIGVLSLVFVGMHEAVAEKLLKKIEQLEEEGEIASEQLIEGIAFSWAQWAEIRASR